MTPDIRSDAPTDRHALVRAGLEEHLFVARLTQEQLAESVVELADDVCRTFGRGGKLLVFGNGGSAADAQHFAAELTGRFQAERRPLGAIALTTDSSVMTAIANDYEYADVFARQVEALCQAGDLCVGISTSGRAENVVRGVRAASMLGARTWALTGGTGGPLREAASRSLVIPSSNTARIQELHITLLHLVCALIDEWAVGTSTPLSGRIRRRSDGSATD